MADMYTGFIVLRLAPGPFGTLITETDDLRLLARKAGADHLSRVLDEYPQCAAGRLITGVGSNQILEMERKATERGFAPPHSLTSYWRIDARGLSDQGRLVELLGQVREVEIAYRQPSGTDPDVDPSNDTHAMMQFHLDAAPVGIDARWAWNHPHGWGSLVGFVDLEQGWFFYHEDLPARRVLLGVSEEMVATSQPHGTAVMGLVVGLDNDRGIVGIAPKPAWVSVTSHILAGIPDQVANAISTATSQMASGDVLLVEWQDASLYPAEVTPDIWLAIQVATGNEIVVIECAGNGGKSLDAFPQIDRDNPVTDSGAIIVGACKKDLDATLKAHDRWFASNFGSRVDCHAPGELLATAGPAKSPPKGELSAGSGPDDAYRNDFAATSGAGAVVAGAAVVLQGMHKAVTGVHLKPRDMRDILSTHGTPQGAGVLGNIGVMPDLKKAAKALGLVPDVYVRDYVGDVGDVPSTGTLCLSPDVIVVPNPVAASAMSFGEASGTENDDTLGSQVLTGQDNFIYVRMQNRGGFVADAVRATAYWSPPATLATPNLWNLIGTSLPVTVPVGDTLVVAPAITWPAAQIPPTGHCCLVVTIDHPLDPAPSTPGAGVSTWADFLSLISNENNIAWRNIDVVNLPATGAAQVEFLIVGAPDKPRKFDFEIIQQLPASAPPIELVIPSALFDALHSSAFGVTRFERPRGQVTLVLPRRPVLSLGQVLLHHKRPFRCHLMFHASREIMARHHVTIRQSFRGLEVGRIKWRFGRESEASRRS